MDWKFEVKSAEYPFLGTCLTKVEAVATNVYPQQIAQKATRDVFAHAANSLSNFTQYCGGLGTNLLEETKKIGLFWPVLTKKKKKWYREVWLAIHFKIMTSCTWAFLPRIIVYNRYVWAFIPYTTIYIAYIRVFNTRICAKSNARLYALLIIFLFCMGLRCALKFARGGFAITLVFENWL